MWFKVCFPLSIGAILAGCTETGNPGGSSGFVDVPENIVAIAAPNQNLSTVRVLPEDGCYWYEHVGPVETTLLPLRNAEGRPICTRPQV